MPTFNSMMHPDKNTYQAFRCKRRLEPKNISLFSFIFQANVYTHYQTFSLNNTLKSTDLRTLCMILSTALGYLNVLQYINCINKLKLYSTMAPKLNPEQVTAYQTSLYLLFL